MKAAAFGGTASNDRLQAVHLSMHDGRREGISARLFYTWSDQLKKRSAFARPEPPRFVALQREPTPHEADPELDRNVEMDGPSESTRILHADA